MLSGKINVTDFNRWMDIEGVSPVNDLEKRCNRDYLEKYLKDNLYLKNIYVKEIIFNTEGTFRAPNLYGSMGKFMPETVYSDLPAFAQVEIGHKTGKYTETTWVWVPLKWNGRFMGCCGGGNRTATFSPEAVYNGMRSPQLPVALRNGFATACTDAGNREDEFFGWGVDFENKTFSRELYENWIKYSTHNMTVIGKAVTKALTLEKPLFSYIFGGSAGGRQVLSEAQNYPADYDGYWSDAPCVSYNRMLLALSWPYVVMNTYNNVLSFAKFEAFRNAVYEKCGGKEKFYNTQEKIEYNAESLIGAETPDGKITEMDALVMNRIWEGARTEDGHFLWYGMRPGVEAWTYGGYSAVNNDKENPKAVNFMLNDEYIKNWLVMDKDYDTSKIDIREYTRLHLIAQEKFADMDTESPDLRDLRDLGGKMIICHGVDDNMIYVDGSVCYYEKIVNLFGSSEEAKDVARLLIVPGDGHCSYNKLGAGPSVATAMEALMNWVENGIAPESIRGQRYDASTGKGMEIKNTPVY